MPNLENLRKQAKQYLRWHRERYYPVAAEIRASLPRFRHLSDEQILDATFKLSHAQELVARQRGFDGWQALISGAHAMTQSRTHASAPASAPTSTPASASANADANDAASTRSLLPPTSRPTSRPMSTPSALAHRRDDDGAGGGDPETEAAADDAGAPRAVAVAGTAAPAAARPTISSTAAQLFVADIAASCAFYAGQLGFVVDFTYGDPPFYAQVSRDHAHLSLRLVCEPVFAGDIREREHLLSASLTVETAAEVKQLFLDYQAAGVRFHHPLRKEPWGARTFIVLDPDDNLILFAGPAD